MKPYAAQNKKAWEHDAYHFWVRESGTPAQRAKEDLANPRKMLRRYGGYLGDVKGIRIANLCGSCGKRAVPLAILGAQVTVFDISEGNRRYACETAEAAGVDLEYIVGDAMEIDPSIYGNAFDIVFMEGGILHYFHELDDFMSIMRALLKDGGTMILSDFHPIHKCLDVLGLQSGQTFSGDYFDSSIVEGEMAHAKFYDEEQRALFPKCLLRRYTLSDIINAVIRAGFTLQRFDEHPAWTDAKLPGEFTIVAAVPRKTYIK